MRALGGGVGLPFLDGPRNEGEIGEPTRDRGLVGGEGRSYSRVWESCSLVLDMVVDLKEPDSLKSKGAGIGRVLELCIRYEGPDMAQRARLLNLLVLVLMLMLK